MKKRFAGSFAITFILLVISCGKSSPTFDHIDLKAWATDKNACTGKRTDMLAGFDAQKEKLLGLSEAQIVELLGTPDETSLYKRNQKFYYYYLQPAAECAAHLTDPKKLFIRFTAMGIAKEVSIQF
jgi:outer membrane protein assembly factor BamE (lipoprotein component of BamABCDE complex)